MHDAAHFEQAHTESVAQGLGILLKIVPAGEIEQDALDSGLVQPCALHDLGQAQFPVSKRKTVQNVESTAKYLTAVGIFGKDIGSFSHRMNL